MFDNRRSGFSLIELMIVVAILGILATLGMPQYAKFKARSRQTEAKAKLTTLYTAQKAFAAEYQTYHWHLPETGFIPEEQDSFPNYPARSTSKAHYGIAFPINNSLPSYDVPDLAALGLTEPPTIPPGGLYDWTFGYRTSAGYCTLSSIPMNVPGTDLVPSGEWHFLNQNSFRAFAIGCPLKNVSEAQAQAGQPYDVWAIDQDRALKNITSGI